VSNPPERRVSAVTDRRRSRRGGRRAIDQDVSSPPAVVPCATCDTGMAGMLEMTIEGRRSRVTYRCRDCGLQFDRIAMRK
jgi:hypothetical protein